MNAMGIACNTNNININSTHHLWQPGKRVIGHRCIEIIYHHTEFVTWVSIVT